MKRILKENVGGIILLIVFVGMFATYMYGVKVNTAKEIQNGVVTYEAK